MERAEKSLGPCMSGVQCKNNFVPSPLLPVFHHFFQQEFSIEAAVQDMCRLMRDHLSSLADTRVLKCVSVICLQVRLGCLKSRDAEFLWQPFGSSFLLLLVQKSANFGANVDLLMASTTTISRIPKSFFANLNINTEESFGNPCHIFQVLQRRQFKEICRGISLLLEGVGKTRLISPGFAIHPKEEQLLKENSSVGNCKTPAAKFEICTRRGREEDASTTSQYRTQLSRRSCTNFVYFRIQDSLEMDGSSQEGKVGSFGPVGSRNKPGWKFESPGRNSFAAFSTPALSGIENIAHKCQAPSPALAGSNVFQNR